MAALESMGGYSGGWEKSAGLALGGVLVEIEKAMLLSMAFSLVFGYLNA